MIYDRDIIFTLIRSFCRCRFRDIKSTICPADDHRDLFPRTNCFSIYRSPEQIPSGSIIRTSQICPTGRIILQKPFPIPADADVEYVYDGLMNLGAGLALETIDLMLAHDGNIPSKDQQQIIDEAQLGELKPAPKIFKETCEIQWQQTAKQLHDFVRGLSPVPGSWTTVSVDGKPTTTLKIYKAAPTARPATGAPGTFVLEKGHIYVNATDLQLELLEVQLSGKKRMDARSFVNGVRTVER